MKLPQLGDRVKDPISGFSGIVTAETTWLYGCRRVGVVSESLDKDGKPTEQQWFDEAQLELVRPGVIRPPSQAPVIGPSAGGPARGEEIR
jgi:hypothetical protein